VDHQEVADMVVEVPHLDMVGHLVEEEVMEEAPDMEPPLEEPDMVAPKEAEAVMEEEKAAAEEVMDLEEKDLATDFLKVEDEGKRS